MNDTVISEITQHIVITQTITNSRLLKKGRVGVDAFTLYNFYCQTSSIQGHTQIKANDVFCMKGLHWGKTKFRNAKNLLISEGIIETIQRRDENNKITGHYVKVKYIKKPEVPESTQWIAPPSGSDHPVENEPTNAIDKKVNARDKNIISNTNKSETAPESEIETKETKTEEQESTTTAQDNRNPFVETLLELFEKLCGHQPIDTHARRQAHALTQTQRKWLRDHGLRDSVDEHLTLNQMYFTWLSNEDWRPQTMRTVREHFKRFLPELEDSYQQSTTGVHHG